MQSRYDFLQAPSECRLLAALRGSVAAGIAAVLAAGALLLPPAERGPTAGPELLPAAAPLLDDGYDGPVHGALPAALSDDAQLRSFDQLHPHAYVGQPGVMG